MICLPHSMLLLCNVFIDLESLIESEEQICLLPSKVIALQGLIGVRISNKLSYIIN